MTLSALIKSIYSVYSVSATDHAQREFNHKLDGLISVIRKAEKDTQGADILAQLDKDVSVTVQGNFDLMLETLDAQAFPRVDSREELLETLTTQYQGAVQEFTNNNGTGFYDTLTVINIRYESGLEPVQQAICDLQEQGHDVRLCEEIIVGNPECSVFRNAAYVAIIYPSSLAQTVEKALQGMADNTLEKVTMHNYLIAPSLNFRPDDAIAFIKDTTKEMREEGEGSYDKNEICLDAITCIGLYRKETTWYDSFSMRMPIYHMLSWITLYTKEGDHVNGMIPSRECYDLKEIQDYGLKPSTKAPDSKRRNIIDEVRIYEENDPLLGNNPIA